MGRQPNRCFTHDFPWWEFLDNGWVAGTGSHSAPDAVLWLRSSQPTYQKVSIQNSTLIYIYIYSFGKLCTPRDISKNCTVAMDMSLCLVQRAVPSQCIMAGPLAIMKATLPGLLKATWNPHPSAVELRLLQHAGGLPRPKAPTPRECVGMDIPPSDVWVRLNIPLWPPLRRFLVDYFISHIQITRLFCEFLCLQ